jgi:hypothetical protein
MALTQVQTAMLGTGAVLQVVNATYGTLIATSTTTFIDSGLTATITPKFATSKILVISTINGSYKNQSNAANCLSLRLVRGSTAILNINGILAWTNTAIVNYVDSSTSYLDSPATTSATTYKIQFASSNNTASVGINGYFTAPGETNSTITLMEIAA